jgi:hypothetical protein
MIVASLCLVVTCAAGFTLVYLHSTKLVAVIAIARNVPVGQSIEVADLKQVNISLAGGLATVPVTEASSVIGRKASVALVAGSLLTSAEIGDTATLPSGQAIVGVDLKPGMLPAGGVAAGETVQVVLTGPAGTPVGEGSTSTTTDSSGSDSGSSISLSAEVITSAEIVAVNDDPDDTGSGDVVVSVEVPVDDAPLVADASAADQAALVQVGG